MTSIGLVDVGVCSPAVVRALPRIMARAIVCAHLSAFLVSPALAAGSQGAFTLSWPFSFYSAYKNAGALSTQSSDSYVVAVPQFPTQVSLAGLYSPITATFQCSGCGSGALDPCMTISSSAGADSSCSQHICDDEPHACSDILPTSTTAPGSYSITVADRNVLKGLSYTITLETGCADASRALDKNVCSTVLANNYSTACACGEQAGGTRARPLPPPNLRRRRLCGRRSHRKPDDLRRRWVRLRRRPC